MTQCPFCNIDKNKFAILPHGNLEIKSTILYESDNFWIIPDIAPIVPFHLLIIPQNHVYSVNELNNQLQDELLRLQSMIIEFYKTEFELEAFFFEHGNCNNGINGSACIAHSHLHSIPLSKEDLRNMLWKISLLLGSPLHKKEKGYLMAEFGKNSKLYWDDFLNKSQFFRITISDYIGHNRVRWQNCLFGEELRLSIDWTNMTISKWNKYMNTP